ncbi:MAG: erythromycin esterase family protein [Myxococcales bacterium]
MASLTWLCCARSGAGPPGAERAPAAGRLAAQVSPLRTVDPDDRDFSDLEALRALVGSARIVMLGERSHGDGVALYAKLRLIEFLHREMGFGVLALESGLDDCRQTFERWRAGDDSEKAASGCLPTKWRGSDQAVKIRRYLSQAARADRPLQLAGFDCQISNRDDPAATARSVAEFLRELSPSLEGSPRLAAITEAVGKLRDYERKRTAAERDRDRAAIADLATLVAAPGPCRPGRAHFQQLAKSLAVQEVSNWDYQSKGDVDIAQINMRDAQMADNLAFLAEVRYPRERIIVSAATYHIMRNAQAIRPIPGKSGGPASMGDMIDGLVPMGELVRRRFGASAIALGFVTAFGHSSCCDRERTQGLDPAPAGSLEAMLEATGQRFALLDLRALRRTMPGETILGRPQGHGFYVVDWPEILDGVVFLREMTTLSPATP